MSEFDPSKLERGRSGWAASEYGGGPDVGHFIGLGGGAWIWIGEIPDAEHAALSDDHKALGDAGGWWIVMHTAAGERLTLGKCAAGYAGDTSAFIDHLCFSLTAPQPPASPSRDSAGDVDAATGCADDQARADISTDALRTAPCQRQHGWRGEMTDEERAHEIALHYGILCLEPLLTADILSFVAAVRAEATQAERERAAKVANKVGGDIDQDEGLKPLDVGMAISAAIRA